MMATAPLLAELRPQPQRRGWKKAMLVSTGALLACAVVFMLLFSSHSSAQSKDKNVACLGCPRPVKATSTVGSIPNRPLTPRRSSFSLRHAQDYARASRPPERQPRKPSLPSLLERRSQADPRESKSRSTRVQAVEAAATEDAVLITSPNDDREYRTITLQNGLQVLLVSDEDADNAAAAMGIACGSWCDPPETLGMAHFLEHMMFLGTKKFPEENDYSSYLSQRGGMSNAYTSSDSTVFFFTVDADYFEGALDRFAQFFIEPLFNPSATDREINAIDSEHKQYLQSDFRRLYEVLKSQANPQHPFSRFATGDKTTLQKDDIRDRLIKFHDEYYSANLMRLTVCGKEPLDTLQSWVEKMFNEVPNKDLPKPAFPVDSPVVPEEKLPSKIDILPIADEHSLLLTWPVPLEFEELNRENPQGYLSYILSSEAPGGLVSELKNREWIASLSGRTFLQNKDLNLFSVSVDLTDSGVEHIDEVIDMIYQYLGDVLRNGINREQWQELVNLAEVDFRFAEKGDPGNLASHTASKRLQDLPLADLLSPPSRQLWRPDLIQQLIKSLKPEKMMLFVSSKKPFNKQVAASTEEHQEKWYGTRYRRSTLTKPQLKLWDASFSGHRKVDPNLSLPSANPYVPSDFTLVEEPLPLKQRRKKQEDETGLWSVNPPKLVKNTTSETLWFSSQAIKEFPVPRAQVLSVMRTALSQQCPKNQALTDIYFDIIGDYLMEALYLPSVAGYSFSMGNSEAGFSLAMQGYSERSLEFLSNALDMAINPPFNPLRFESIKEETLRAFKNFYQSQPYEQASHFMGRATNPEGFSLKELEKATAEVTLNDVKAYIPKLFASEWSLETLVNGNLKESQAEDINNLIRTKLQPAGTNATAATPNQQKFQLDVGEGSSYTVPITLANPEELNSATIVKYQLGSRKMLSTKDLAMATLIGSMIQEPAFDELRTKQQLGYIVSAGMGVSQNVFALSAIVQGAEHSAEYYDSQIEAFCKNFLSQLKSMPEEELNSFKASLESALLRRDLNLGDRGVRFWDPIAKQLYNFSWNLERVKALRTVTRDDLVKFYTEKIVNPSTRRRISIRMESPAEATREVPLVNPPVEAVTIAEVDDLRARLKPFSSTA